MWDILLHKTYRVLRESTRYFCGQLLLQYFCCSGISKNVISLLYHLYSCTILLKICVMNIVFNVNPLGLEGLGATLISLIRNCSDSQSLKLWFLCSEFNKNDRINIDKLLIEESFLGEVTYINFDAKSIFGRLKPLHGDWTAYGRLLIPDYIPDDTALYLDSDLIVLADVLTLTNFDFKDRILAAAFECKVGWSIDKSFLIDRLNYAPEQDYFNSGIVYFNLKRWRATNAEAKWKKLAEKYPNELISHDQTLLNAVCEGDFAYLAPNFNNGWLPGDKKPADAVNSILHFVGSPKPWDIFGRFIHGGYGTWKEYSNEAWEKEYSTISIRKIRRTWNIKNSIVRYALHKLRNK